MSSDAIAGAATLLLDELPLVHGSPFCQLDIFPV